MIVAPTTNVVKWCVDAMRSKTEVAAISLLSHRQPVRGLCNDS